MSLFICASTLLAILAIFQPSHADTSANERKTLCHVTANNIRHWVTDSYRYQTDAWSGEGELICQSRFGPYRPLRVSVCFVSASHLYEDLEAERLDPISAKIPIRTESIDNPDSIAVNFSLSKAGQKEATNSEAILYWENWVGMSTQSEGGSSNQLVEFKINPQSQAIRKLQSLALAVVSPHMDCFDNINGFDIFSQED